jgi:hypothetical protein
MSTFQDDMKEDESEFLSDFGIEALYTPNGGVERSVTVIFDKRYPSTDTEGRIIYTPMIEQVRTDDILEIKKNDVFKVEGISYFAIEPLPDDNGFRKIKLSEHRAR